MDEVHHAAADTYQKILAFFQPAFTLGLTATPERNRLIVDIWLRYAQNKRTVVFRDSVWHAKEIAELFVARPTMSRLLYTQQLGRGTRLYQGKESLMVFDFVDNASQYNLPMSLHRLFKLREYRAGELVLSPGTSVWRRTPPMTAGRSPSLCWTGLWMPRTTSWWTFSTDRRRPGE